MSVMERLLPLISWLLGKNSAPSTLLVYSSLHVHDCNSYKCAFPLIEA